MVSLLIIHVLINTSIINKLKMSSGHIITWILGYPYLLAGNQVSPSRPAGYSHDKSDG